MYTRESIRRLLHPNPQDTQQTGGPGEARLELKPAAVLVPLVNRGEGLTLLLTKRSDHLAHHPGQVSFPGGRMEARDAGPVETALRETEEEIGLDRRHVQIAGFMDPYRTVSSHFLITPVVGFIDPPFTLKADPFEVAEVFEAPLSLLLDPRNHERRHECFRGRRQEFYAVRYKGYNIWGATAAMLVNLSKRLHQGHE